MKTALNIGHSEEAISERGKLVLSILASPAGGKVKVAALKALTKMLTIENVSIDGFSYIGDTTHTHHHYPEPKQSEADSDSTED